MGQRLVINIYSDSKPLASGYFHWSNTTWEAAELTKIIVDSFEDTKYIAKRYFYYDKDKSKEELEELEQKLTSFILLENLGAGIYFADEDTKEVAELEKLCPRYNYRIGKNRASGLIALSEGKIREFNAYAERSVGIDIVYETLKFDVILIYTEDEIEKYKENDPDLQICEINSNDLLYTEFKNFDEWYNRIDDFSRKPDWFFKDKNSSVYYSSID